MSTSAIYAAPEIERRPIVLSRVNTFLARYSNQLFLLFIGLSLIPVIRFHYLPTSDGPSHVYNSKLLVDYYLRKSQIAHEYFQPNPAPVPNWFSHVFMAGAMCVLLPLLAERLLIAGYVALLPLAFRYALRSVSRNTAGQEFLIFPFVYNSHLHWGFYSFCYSLVFYLLALGFWIRHSGETGWRKLGQFLSLILLTYFSHPIGFYELFIAVSFLWAWGLICGREGADALRGLRGDMPWLLASRGGCTFLVGGFLPAFVLCAVFLRNQLQNSSTLLEWPSLRYAASTLLKLDPLKSFVNGERYCSMGISFFLTATLVFFGLAAFRNKGILQESKYLVLALLCAALVFASPVSAAGGTMITPRLVYFPVFIFLLWLAAQASVESLRAVFLIVGVVSALILHVLHGPVYAHYDLLMKQFISINKYIDSDKTLLFVTFGDPFPQNLHPVTKEAELSGTAGAYIAVLRDLVYLNNYEAATHHFPFVFRSDRDPSRYLFHPSKARANSLSHSVVDLSGYEKTTGQYVDYVLLWGLNTAEGRDKFQKDFAPQLQALYEEVDTIPSQQITKLFRRSQGNRAGRIRESYVGNH